jgi:uncharacterized RDD family membrane protein YckC
MRRLKKTGLVLVPEEAAATHVALFENVAQSLGLALVYLTAGSDCARTVLHANFVLADLTGNDPSVVCYVGVAHTFEKRVFLVTDAIDRLPYDLGSSRSWVIEPYSENQEIQRAIAQFLSIPYAIGPVRLMLGNYAFFGENVIARRFLAFLIDAACLLACIGLVLAFTETGHLLAARFVSIIQTPTRHEILDWENTAFESIWVWAFYATLAYFALSTWVLRATLGQLIIGLRVVQSDYRKAGFGTCLSRSLLSMLVIVTWGAAYLSALRGPGYRAVHDILSGAIVVQSQDFVAPAVPLRGDRE